MKRKLTLMLALLFVWTGAAWSQGVTVKGSNFRRRWIAHCRGFSIGKGYYPGNHYGCGW